jgi:hypothetical protein
VRAGRARADHTGMAASDQSPGAISGRHPPGAAAALGPEKPPSVHAMCSQDMCPASPIDRGFPVVLELTRAAPGLEWPETGLGGGFRSRASGRIRSGQWHTACV